MLEQFLWCERYRPKTIEETILPDNLKKVFQQFVDQKNIPNLLLTGTAGVGKTTVAKAMCEEIGLDYLFMNASSERGIDDVRVKITNYASAVSLSGGRKVIILDEADNLTNDAQLALRASVEAFANNCTFILTCNYKARLIEAIHSRSSVIDFKISKSDMAKLAVQFLKRVESILTREEVEYDKAVVAQVIQKHFPDWRRVLNELQRYSAIGKIDSGILTNLKEVSLKELVKMLKSKDFSGIRQWVGENLDNDQDVVFRSLYDTCSEYLAGKENEAQLVLLLAKYQYQAAFVADQEINLMACLTEMMIDLEYA